jgi:anti-anti-sigma factor
MNQSSAKLMVAVFDHVVCVKINGRADFTLSLDLKKVIQELSQRGYHRFVVELRDCVTMDSTFLGTLSGMALKFHETGGPQDHLLELFNPSPRIAETLENLGVAHLFKIVSCAEPLAVNFEPLTGAGGQSKEAVTRHCLEAHNLLMGLNPENVHRFKDVAQFLAEDLKRLEQAGQK